MKCVVCYVGALSFTFILSACVSDAPSSLLQKGSSNAVDIHSSRSPYAVTSRSILNAESKNSRQWTQRKLASQSQRLMSGNFRNWRWSVWAPPKVVASWRLWRQSREARDCRTAPSNSSCQALDWDSAFRRLYKATAYLLGKAPLPLWVRLDLVPQGDGFRQTRFWRSQRYVPLEFSFWYPVIKGAGPTSQHRRAQALLETIALVGYELQHVEYDAGDAEGPGWPPAQSALKNEANSACWRTADKLAIAAGRLMTVKIQRIDDKTFTAFKPMLGDRARFSTAAVGGPVLVWHDLEHYLDKRQSVSVNRSQILIRATNYRAMNGVLAYCRGMTRYTKAVSNQGLPASSIANVGFWPPAGKSRRPLPRE